MCSSAEGASLAALADHACGYTAQLAAEALLRIGKAAGDWAAFEAASRFLLVSYWDGALRDGKTY